MSIRKTILILVAFIAIINPMARASRNDTLPAAISWIDDDFTAFNKYNQVSPKYQMLHDYCVEKQTFVDFALVPFGFPCERWKPQERIEVVHQWRDEGFGFLMHPVHKEGGWYDYNDEFPHDSTKVEQAVIDCKKAFELYGLEPHPILVWPGDSYKFEDNMNIVKRHYECAITSTYIGVNHLAENNQYTLTRLSFEALKKGLLTKTEFKNLIKEAVDAGDWLILASHFYTITISDEPDETSYNTANVFELIDYANSLCPLRSTVDVWNERKHLWEESFIANDVNKDGLVDVTDINVIVNVILGNEPDASNYKPDVNNDGLVDVADIDLIINYILSLTDTNND